jgi:probable F420-dependent oxidoreductase
MKFGMMFANTGPFGTAEGARALGAALEDTGFESAWTVEHVVVPKGYQSTYPYDPSGRMPGGEEIPFPDPLVWLTWLGATTTRLTLATGILILPQRNPLLLAKECATLDQLTGGRFVLGIGAGWLAEEFDALGIPFDDRGRRTDDHIRALRSAWGEQPARYDGELVRFGEVYALPRPVDGTIPIVVGGHSDAAARRAGRLGDGFFPGRGRDEELVHLLDVMRAAATEAGRDPDGIEITVVGLAALGPDPVGALHRYEDLGVHRVLIPPLTYNPTDVHQVLADFADKAITKLA